MQYFAKLQLKIDLYQSKGNLSNAQNNWKPLIQEKMFIQKL